MAVANGYYRLPLKSVFKTILFQKLLGDSLNLAEEINGDGSGQICSSLVGNFSNWR